MRYATALIMLMLPAAASWADVYRSVDAQGHVQYSDTYSPGAERIALSGRTTADLSAAADKTAAKPAPSSDDAAKAPLSHEQAQQAVQKDVQASRDEECKKATDAYQHYVQSRRIYNVSASGEREYLSDTDADQLRTNAREAMQSACASSS